MRLQALRAFLNWCRVGRWPSCQHEHTAVHEVRSALSPGVRWVRPACWTVCRTCHVALQRRCASYSVLFLLLCLPAVSLAYTMPVIDVGQLVEMAKQFQQQIQMYREMLLQSEQQVQQIRNQIQQIQHAATTVQHGVQNLLTLDLNNMADLLALSDQLERKLQYAEHLGYESARAWEQAKGLYPQIQGILTGKQQRDLRRQWAAAERSTARAALETQAIAASQRQYAQEWQEALQRAVQAKGALQIEQAQAQMLGLQGGQLQQIQQHLATTARQATIKDLQQASETEAELAAVESAIQPYNVSDFTPAGRLLPMPRTGQE